MVTIALYKKLYLFFIKSVKSKKKEAGTNFVLLCYLRNMVEQFNKDYLHRPFKILHFLTPTRTQKCLT